MMATSVSRRIDPRWPVELGAGSNGGSSWSVDDHLEVNCLALFPDDGDPVVVVTFDLLYVGPDLETMILTAFEGIPRQNIFIAASHTHAAPMTDRTKPALGRVDDGYLQLVQDELESAAKILLDPARRHSAVIRVAAGLGSFSVNRRRFKRFYLARKPLFNQILIAPNPEGPKDETITLLEVSQDDGTPIAYVWNYACHPVSYPNNRAVSAHFPGVARAKLRAAVAPNTPVLYFQGFSGNTRPMGAAHVHSMKERIRSLFSGPLFGGFTPQSYREWAEDVASGVMSLLPALEDTHGQEISTSRREHRSTDFVEGCSFPVSFQALRIGNAFGLVGVSAEVVAEYAAPARDLLDAHYSMVVGCLDTPFGYAPTSVMLAEGGYEAGGYLVSFGLGSISPSVESNMIAGLSKVTSQLSES